MDPYQVLGVPNDASLDEIKRRYRELARKHHPDVNPGDAESESRFKDIGNAYSVLSDADKRAAYDARGTMPFPGFSTVDFGTGFRVSVGRGGGPFDSPFGMPFGVHFGGRQPSNSNVLVRVPMTLQELLTGKQIKLRFDRIISCDTCSGRGILNETCPDCNGTGEEPSDESEIPMTCRRCRGVGRTSDGGFCQSCSGTGVRADPVELTVSLPPGMNVAPHVIRGEGNRETGDASPGDVVIAASIRLPDGTKVTDINLITETSIDPAMFVVGGHVEMEGPFGEPVEFDVKEDARFTELVSIAGAGLPSSQGHPIRRSPLLVRLIPEWPDPMDERRREILRRYLDGSDAGGIPTDVE
jgi:molecular chaperone DnaJ